MDARPALVLTPSLPLLRRAAGTLQVGLDPQRAVVVAGVSPAAEPVLLRRDHDDLSDALRRSGASWAERRRLLTALGDARLLVDPAHVPVAPAEPADARLAPDRASVALLSGDPSHGGRDVLAARAAAWVEVQGAGRVGAMVAGLLAAAGVGHVVVEDEGRAEPWDLPPGTALDELGVRRATVARRVAQRSADGVRTDPPDRAPGAADAVGDGPDLVVVSPAHGLGRRPAHEQSALGRAHLVALVVETTGLVGPLVVPGVTSCLHCQDLHRAERDPAWPRLLLQAERPPDPSGRQPSPCDITLAAMVAAQAAQQAVAFLDGLPTSTTDATLETTLPAGLTRRRSWHAHPACGCQWDGDR